MILNDKTKNLKEVISSEKNQEDLFPPLIKKLNRVKINVLINNKYIFPKVGILGNESKPYYVGHTKPITKLIFINNKILCSVSQDSVSIKIWDLNNFNSTCRKNIEVNFIISDIIHANENNLVLCGEKLIKLNVDTEKQINIFKPKFGNYIEYNLLAKINDELGVASSLVGGYFLIFNIITGEKIKKIEMNNIHFVCDTENKRRLLNNSLKEKPQKNIKDQKNKDSFQEENEQEKDYSLQENKENDNERKKDKKIDIKDIGSSKCLRTEKGHKGQIYCIIGLNNNIYKDCIVSGGFDNLIKIFNIHDENKVIDLNGHENTVTNLVLSESRKFLFSSSLDFTIRKWNLENASCENIIKYDTGTQYILIPLMNDCLFSIGYDGKINIWNEECLLAKSYHYQHGAITTGIIYPSLNETERNIIFFGDHTGEIFIKQIIIGDEDIKNYNKSKKMSELRGSKIRKSMKKRDKSKNNNKIES